MNTGAAIVHASGREGKLSSPQDRFSPRRARSAKNRGGVYHTHAMRSKLASVLFLLSFWALPSSAQKDFSQWPAGSSPRAIGKRVAERFVGLPHRLTTNQAEQPYIDYPESVTWYGALTFAQLSGDKPLTA